jgi:hypothetical protein
MLCTKNYIIFIQFSIIHYYYSMQCFKKITWYNFKLGEQLVFS